MTDPKNTPTSPRIGIGYVSNRGDRYLPGAQASFGRSVDTTGVETTDWVIDDQAGDLGMAGAFQASFDRALAGGCDYLFHVEEDFVFTSPVRLLDLVTVLERNRYLAQICLLRQPWGQAEERAGGIIALDPPAYTQVEPLDGSGFAWIEHERLFSMNPCLIPRRVLELGWPAGPLGVGNESGFTARTLAAGYRFAYWGRLGDGPRVIHRGSTRGDNYNLGKVAGG